MVDSCFIVNHTTWGFFRQFSSHCQLGLGVKRCNVSTGVSKKRCQYERIYLFSSYILPLFTSFMNSIRCGTHENQQKKKTLNVCFLRAFFLECMVFDLNCLSFIQFLNLSNSFFYPNINFHIDIPYTASSF